MFLFLFLLHFALIVLLWTSCFRVGLFALPLCGAAVAFFAAPHFVLGFYGTCVRVGLLALPLCGAAVTFFAAAKKVTKETAIPSLSTSGRPRHRTSQVVRQ